MGKNEEFFDHFVCLQAPGFI